MFRFFSPAAALMKRLMYLQKFALIGGLLSLPVVFLVGFTLYELHAGISRLETELDGLEYHRAVRALQDHLQQHRAYFQSVSGGDDAWAGELQRSREQIAADLGALDRLASRRDESLGVGSEWAQLRSQWHDIDAQRDALGREDHYDRETELIAGLINFGETVAERSMLLLDSNSQRHYLVETIVGRLPRLTENLAEASVWASSRSTKTLITGNDRFRITNVASLVDDDLAAIRHNIGMVPEELALGPGLEESDVPTYTFIQLVVKEYLLSAETAVMFPHMFALRGAAAVDANWTFYDSVSAKLGGLLRQQAQRMRVRAAAIVLFIAIVGLAVVYLSMGFYAHLMETICGLEAASRQMSEGEFESVAFPESRDELTQVVNAFRALGARLRSEWEMAARAFAAEVGVSGEHEP